MAKYKLLEAGFFQVKCADGPQLYPEGSIIDVPEETIPGPHMQPLDAAARTASAGMELISNPHTRGGHTDADLAVSPQNVASGFAKDDSPFSPESLGASFQSPVDGFVTAAWNEDPSYKRLAQCCINRCSPRNTEVHFGCLLPIQRDPATGNFRGEASGCKVLCNGQRCEALESLNPQLRNSEPGVEPAGRGGSTQAPPSTRYM